MSSTEMYGWSKENGWEKIFEFANSHGGATMVWSALWRRYVFPSIPEEVVSRRYLRSDTVPLGFREDDENDLLEKVWELSQNHNVFDFERITLLTTFDRRLLRKKNFDVAADAFRMFYYAHSKPGSACSLLDQARVLSRLKDTHPHVSVVGWNQTSVQECVWGDAGFKHHSGCAGDCEGEDPDCEHLWYDVETGEDHWWVFWEEEQEKFPFEGPIFGSKNDRRCTYCHRLFVGDEAEKASLKPHRPHSFICPSDSSRNRTCVRWWEK